MGAVPDLDHRVGAADITDDELEAFTDAQFDRHLDLRHEFDLAVDRAAERLRVQDAARQKVAAEQIVDAPPFDAGLLVEMLARPSEPAHRVEGLIPSRAGTVVVAARKAGKTTFELNLARSLIRGDDFLGRFPVRAITGRVGFLNYEVAGGQLARWADEHQVDRQRFYQVNLRGRRNPLGNTNDRAGLAEQLREHDVEALFVDPFGRAFTGQSQNDAGEVGAWLADLDRWARGDVGALDVILSVHAGWNGERTRGSSALEDWADVMINIARDPDDDRVRYLRAEGRDVEVDEDRLDFDNSSRTLTLAGAGSRKVAAVGRQLEDLLPQVVAYVRENPGCAQADIEKAVSGRGPVVRQVAALAAERGLIERTKSANRWTHQPLVPTRPTSSRTSGEYSSPRPYRDEDEYSDESSPVHIRDGTSSEPVLDLGRLPGRCLTCEHHIETQGHRAGCPAREAS